MAQSVSKIPVAPSEKFSDAAQKFLHWIFFAAFLFFVCLQITFVFFPQKNSSTFEALLVLAAFATTITAMSRQLPFQNVLLAAVIIAVISGASQTLGVLTGIPFGPCLYTSAAGPKIFNTLPWSVPFIWIIVMLNSRGVGRLILRPWRKSRVYGFRLIGLTTILAIIFDFGLEPFATRVGHYWFWQPTKLHLLWQGTPASNFLGWLVTALLILAFATPVLINKSHKKFPPDYHALFVWVLLSALFATGAAKHQLWSAVGFIAAANVVVLIFSIRGARW
jgi:uncharacterized membrane protein